MYSSIEKDLDWIENEAAAQKKAFERMPYSISVSTYIETVELTPNIQSYVNTQILSELPADYYYCCKQITLDTYAGINTVAKLGLSRPNATIRRIPYTGGARWIVRFPIETAPWDTSDAEISVYSVVPGELTIEDI